MFVGVQGADGGDQLQFADRLRLVAIQRLAVLTRRSPFLGDGGGSRCDRGKYILKYILYVKYKAYFMRHISTNFSPCGKGTKELTYKDSSSALVE